jgi:anaerobic magnesium-protoporphyrin IX monomethyl ester cyclase
MVKVVLVGEVLKYRSFKGANKALPVLASSLRRAGLAEAVQLDLERPDLTIEDVCRESSDADLVVFAGVMTPQWPELDADLQTLTRHLAARGSQAPLIVGGYATKGVEDIARHSPYVTAFFNGEGERGIVEIAAAVARGTFASAMASIEGLCFLREDGVFHRSTAPRAGSLDEVDQGYGFVHVPSVHDMDIFRAQDGRQLKTAQLYTQRGCPWACGYCNKSTEGSQVARLGEEALRDQLRRLRADGFEAVYLDVDTFTVSERAARDEARILAEEGFAWGSNTRIDRISAELTGYFREHGCAYMFFGVEHTNPGVLLAIGKFNGSLGAQLQRIRDYPGLVRRVFRDMHQAGLPSSYFLILGLPKAVLDDEQRAVTGFRPTTFEEDVAAISFGLEACEPDYLNFNMLRFMPGSAAADVPSHPAYGCVRPSADDPVTAGYFLPRVAGIMGYRVPENHGVYRLCESVGPNQPTTTAMDPDRVYASVLAAMGMINARIDAGRKPTALFIDAELLAVGLVRRDSAGRYTAAPLEEFARL